MEGGTSNIAGIGYWPGYISEAEAAALMAEADERPWDETLKRRVQHYGYRYDYTARQVRADDCLGPLPEFLKPLINRLVADNMFRQPPQQVIINEYLPGQGIAPHIDCAPCFGDVVASLSIGSPCEMTFDYPQTGRCESLSLLPQSLIVLTGDARFLWRHTIPARKTDIIDSARHQRRRRISFTFRTIRPTS